MASFNEIKSTSGFFLHEKAKRIWLISMLLFVGHQILQKALSINIKWLDNWLDPLLFPIILMPLLRWERQIITGKQRYVFSVFESAVVIISLVILSELLFPLLSNRFTADPIDGVVIIIGGILFHKFMQ